MISILVMELLQFPVHCRGCDFELQDHQALRMSPKVVHLSSWAIDLIVSVTVKRDPRGIPDCIHKDH